MDPGPYRSRTVWSRPSRPQIPRAPGPRSSSPSGDQLAEDVAPVASLGQPLVLAQPAQRAPDAALDGADADAEDAGDLRIGTAFVVAQHEHRALHFREARQRLPEHGA